MQGAQSTTGRYNTHHLAKLLVDERRKHFFPKLMLRFPQGPACLVLPQQVLVISPQTPEASVTGQRCRSARLDGRVKVLQMCELGIYGYKELGIGIVELA